MAGAAGYVLLVAEDRRQPLLQALAEDEFFAEAEDEFKHSRNLPLICFISFVKGFITHLAVGSRGARAATEKRRLNLLNTLQMQTPLAYAQLIEAVGRRFQYRLADILETGGLVPPATFVALADAVRNLAPEASSYLARYSRSRSELIEDLSASAQNSLAAQKEAVATALELADMERADLQEWEPPGVGLPGSFLEGLPQARLREDPMVINDLNQVPGFRLIRQSQIGAAVFENEDAKLTVVLANRLPLEKQLGADLIYYNETHSSFVIVQYKAMEKLGSHDSIFRLPNKLLSDEIARMRKTLATLKQKGRKAIDRAGYRFVENPFFLKLCPRLIFNPDNKGLVKGMYLPLDYWTLIESDKKLKGPSGGRGVTFENVGRYIDNTEFVNLVAKGWFGTTTSQSAILRLIIREIITTGRTLVLAVKKPKR